jgi:hypothetical protein
MDLLAHVVATQGNIAVASGNACGSTARTYAISSDAQNKGLMSACEERNILIGWPAHCRDNDPDWQQRMRTVFLRCRASQNLIAQRNCVWEKIHREEYRLRSRQIYPCSRDSERECVVMRKSNRFVP